MIASLLQSLISPLIGIWLFGVGRGQKGAHWYARDFSGKVCKYLGLVRAGGVLIGVQQKRLPPAEECAWLLATQKLTIPVPRKVPKMQCDLTFRTLLDTLNVYCVGFFTLAGEAASCATLAFAAFSSSRTFGSIAKARLFGVSVLQIFAGCVEQKSAISLAIFFSN